ncbi:histone deacetylase family protein [Tropicibacter naphthalenivorans]|uniref:Histone deacetylase-like amidohydrolase n=1 Tax=Tropicibacter naphthalenivorans TaxID=441103 RepID=A0A0P1G8Y4_9RHOB|nr:histone deacetylase family protein [Tropicibacter naphthalenivorans]CUH78058.1 Histone deacetylase-like amidohydrolase [Tropicibacter naphthalenivorans]SMC93969.1 Acetoin utilization deacetylase AcuC [Tropicibacter naphthalenivorans]
MATALITHADCLEHVTPDGHPERVARLEHVWHALADLDLVRESAPEADDAALLRCHPQAYIDRIAAAEPAEGIHQLDEDTWMSPGSMRAARRGVGGALRAVDMVLGGEVQNAFCATRPPGHHAETQTPMGFCLFGTAALAAKYALDVKGLSRVAVVDFDVHHGNGTQDLLWDEPRTLFIGSHQMPLWPGTGTADERGAHDNIQNIPLDPGSTGTEMRAAWEPAIARLAAFNPELLIISAGFDAHKDDPLAQLDWETEDFAWITRALCDMAAKVCGGRVVSTLEGGYDLSALSAAARVHVQELMGAAR